MGIVWGLVAALGWGTADFVARDASVRLGAYRALLYAHLLSLVVLGLGLLLYPGVVVLSAGSLALGALLGGLNTLGSLLLYRSLSIGQVAVVSPIGASFAALTLALSLLSGDQISQPKVIGLILTVLGVILAATPPAAAALPATVPAGRGVPEALGAAVAFGVTFWGLKYVVPQLGPLVPVLESRAMSVLLLPLLARPLRQSVAWPPRPVWPLLVTIAVLDTSANAAYNLGLHSDAPGVVAVLGALFSPITVLLAFVLLRERLASRQWAGVLLIFGAITYISAA